MTNSSAGTDTVSVGAAVFRFTWVYILASVAIVAIALALEAFLNFDTGKNSAFAVLPFMVAGTSTGQYYATRTRTRPRGGKAWAIAFFGLVTAVIFNGGVGYVLLTLTDGWRELGLSGSWTLRGDERWLVPAFLAVVVLLLVGLIRLFLWMGANPVIKRLEKQAKSAF